MHKGMGAGVYSSEFVPVKVSVLLKEIASHSVAEGWERGDTLTLFQILSFTCSLRTDCICLARWRSFTFCCFLGRSIKKPQTLELPSLPRTEALGSLMSVQHCAPEVLGSLMSVQHCAPEAPDVSAALCS